MKFKTSSAQQWMPLWVSVLLMTTLAYAGDEGDFFIQDRFDPELLRMSQDVCENQVQSFGVRKSKQGYETFIQCLGGSLGDSYELSQSRPTSDEVWIKTSLLNPGVRSEVRIFKEVDRYKLQSQGNSASISQRLIAQERVQSGDGDSSEKALRPLGVPGDDQTGAGSAR